MVDFYAAFLGARIAHESKIITFMTIDEKDHRVAILQIPGLTQQDSSNGTVGMAHVSFGYANLQDLATSYEQKKARGCLPHWVVNHGMTTSMYYHDPDGNSIETQVDNFDTDEECVQYMNSEKFTENPIGVDYDPEDFVRRVRSGEDEKSIKKRPDIGPRLTV